MARIEVTAGETLLLSYVRTPMTGLMELIWNAFDADAETVTISVEENALSAPDALVVEDDGLGMSDMAANRAFRSLGDSWKRMPGTLSEDKKRVVHGKNGHGRYAAYAIGANVVWESMSAGQMSDAALVVRGSSDDLKHFDIDSIPLVRSSRGTRVSITNLTPAAKKLLEDRDFVRNKLLTTFALYLDRHDFRIVLFGETLDPQSVQLDRREVSLDLPTDISGPAMMTVIDWDLVGVERRIYLCPQAGTVVAEMPARIHSPGSEFTAYITWAGFETSDQLLRDEEDDSPAGIVLAAGKAELKTYLSERRRVKERKYVGKWQDEKAYPFDSEPADQLEAAKRQAFNVVAISAAKTIESVRTIDAKRLILELLKDAFEKDPATLVPVLRQAVRLPQDRLDELNELLDKTTLSNIVQVTHQIGDRLDFIQALNAMVFDPDPKKQTLERRELHRILARETWLFGEEWSLTGDDERLNEVLRNHLRLLGDDVELADPTPILREDGRVGIPDLVLGRKLRTSKNQYEQLVIELKRPNHTLTDEDVSQLRSYASAIFNDERFSQQNVSWNFWLIGNEMNRTVFEQCHQRHLPTGVVQDAPYSITVKTWAEIIGDAEYRLGFIQETLNYTSNKDSGVQYLRSNYEEFLPSSLRSQDPSRDEEDDDPAARKTA